MLPVFICEDNLQQRKKMEELISNYIMMEELGMKIVLSTDNPYDVLNYIESRPKRPGVYFLDVDLGSDMTGIGLGSRIRKVDTAGKIIFVTTHGEMTPLTFMYKVEALDYIVKDLPEGIENRVKECLKLAYESYLADNNPERRVYHVRVHDRVTVVNLDDIMFISSSGTPHTIHMHLENSQFDYSGSLKEAHAELPEFYRCHKSYLINPKNVKEVNKSANEVEMVNEEIALVAIRKMSGLIKLLKQNKNL